MPLRRLLRAFVRAGLPGHEGFWDGVAWFARIVLICVHLAFAVPAVVRPNTPLFLPSYATFDDVVPFSVWGWAGLAVAALLWTLPPRVPWGVLSTALSAFYLYLIGAVFMQTAGLISGVLIYIGFGGLAGLLLMRALWAWVEPQAWFRARTSRRRHGR